MPIEIMVRAGIRKMVLCERMSQETAERLPANRLVRDGVMIVVCKVISTLEKQGKILRLSRNPSTFQTL